MRRLWRLRHSQQLYLYGKAVVKLLFVRRLFHPGQKSGLVFTLTKGFLARPMSIMFGMFWGILALLRRPCSFVIHCVDLMFFPALTRGQR